MCISTFSSFCSLLCNLFIACRWQSMIFVILIKYWGKLKLTVYNLVRTAHCILVVNCFYYYIASSTKWLFKFTLHLKQKWLTFPHKRLQGRGELLGSSLKKKVPTSVEFSRLTFFPFPISNLEFSSTTHGTRPMSFTYVFPGLFLKNLVDTSYFVRNFPPNLFSLFQCLSLRDSSKCHVYFCSVFCRPF